MKFFSTILLAVAVIPTLGSSQEFGEKSVFTVQSINENLSIRIMCSTAKDDGLSSMARTAAMWATTALPSLTQFFILNGLEKALIVSPGEGYCAVIATEGDRYSTSSGISAGSIFTSAVRDGEITATETDSFFCKHLSKFGVCWEDVKSGETELSGVVGCFEAIAANDRFSIVVGREDVLASVPRLT